MREPRQIVNRWRQGSASILVTLVRVQGSSYRRLGARLAICNDGTYEGSISAGCLEGDLLRKAAWLIRDGAAMHRYSTLFDEAAEMPFGLGCGGVLDVLLEPVDTSECRALLEAIEATIAGHEHVVATWLPSDEQAMKRAVFQADGQLMFASAGISDESLFKVRDNLAPHADDHVDGAVVERLTPPQRLFVFGAGDDAKPLVTMACMLGWNVIVADGRSHLARKARFLESDAQIAPNPETALQQVNPRDAAVVMSHSYEQDREYLTSLLAVRPKYLGLLGSRQRSALLIADAALKLDMSISECCEHICAPIGLDIGGDGPEAIALAILAEAQACCTGKQSDSRKLSAEHVQQYIAQTDARTYSQTQCALDLV